MSDRDGIVVMSHDEYERKIREAKADELRKYADAIDYARQSIGAMTAEWIALSMRERARQLEEGDRERRREGAALDAA